jgi:hypothetical protein
MARRRDRHWSWRLRALGLVAVLAGATAAARRALLVRDQRRFDQRYGPSSPTAVSLADPPPGPDGTG